MADSCYKFVFAHWGELQHLPVGRFTLSDVQISRSVFCRLRCNGLIRRVGKKEKTAEGMTKRGRRLFRWKATVWETTKEFRDIADRIRTKKQCCLAGAD